MKITPLSDPQMMPAMAIPLPPPSTPLLFTWLYPMIPKMIASSAGKTMKQDGSEMIPNTSDATQNPLLVPAASSVVPSIVKGIPQLLQLLALIGAGGGTSRAFDVLLALGVAKYPRRTLAGGGVGVNGMRVLLDDLAGLGVDQPAVTVQNRDGDVVAAGGALPVLRRPSIRWLRGATSSSRS